MRNSKSTKRVSGARRSLAQLMLAYQEIKLRERLTKYFNVPPNFMDLAVKIWWDGKED